MNAQEFLTEQKEKLLHHPLFSDPFIKTISSLEIFEIEVARRFALLYYPHILRTRLYQANTLGITPDELIQLVLAEILYDEYGEGDITKTHMAQYRKFLFATGVTPDDLHQQHIIPELQMYINTMMRLTQSDAWISAVAAVGIASEHPIPQYYTQLLHGLRNIPGIYEEHLELFIGHVELDIEHSNKIEQAVLPYLDNRSNRILFTKGIKINMDARRRFHTGLYRELFTNQ